MTPNYKKLYRDLELDYAIQKDEYEKVITKLRESLTKAQERILSLEVQLEKYESLDELIESIEE